MEYKDLTEEEKLLINLIRTDSWKQSIHKLWEIIVKNKKV